MKVILNICLAINAIHLHLYVLPYILYVFSIQLFIFVWYMYDMYSDCLCFTLLFMFKRTYFLVAVVGNVLIIHLYL